MRRGLWFVESPHECRVSSPPTGRLAARRAASAYTLLGSHVAGKCPKPHPHMAFVMTGVRANELSNRYICPILGAASLGAVR